MSLPLVVIDPAIVWPEDAGFREVVGDWPGEVVRLRPGLCPSEVPDSGWRHEAAAVVVMGSRASVHDDRPWIRSLGEWLDPILAGRIRVPLLGICFGHQLIAHRLGAEVGYVHEDRSLERGVQRSEIQGSRLLPGRERIHVIVSHGEEVKTVPAGYRVCASRRRVAVDAIEHETLPIFGVQFHPEARAEFLRAREVPPVPEEAEAFADQAQLLATFRGLVWAVKS